MREPVLTGLCAALLITGCASLHHYQLGDIDASRGKLTPFEIQVDETGLDTQEALEVSLPNGSTSRFRDRKLKYR